MSPSDQAPCRRIQTVTAALSSGAAQRIRVDVEGEIYAPDRPGITLGFPRKWRRDDWYLLGHEAAALGEFLRRAAAAGPATRAPSVSWSPSPRLG